MFQTKNKINQMANFIIKEIKNTDLNKELKLIGYDGSYIHKALDKFRYKTIKIYNLTIAQANILKQLALSVGADCGTNKNVITGQIELSDAILGGSFSQLFKISDKLSHQPFSLKILGENIKTQLNEKNTKTKIMGILNITNNSFSDGGEFYSLEKSIKHFEKLINDGADIIDIGAESTKPNAEPIPSNEQIKRILPVLEYYQSQNHTIPISIDTRNSDVAEICLKNGATIINDVSGLKYDKEMGKIISKNNAKLILQHSLGNKINMAKIHNYKNIVEDVFKDLYEQTEYAKFLGINDIIIDVGIGFDKTEKENFEILKRIEEFYSLGYPVMTGISRKSLLNLKEKSNEEKDIYTMAFNTLLVEHKVDYIRVHNVKMHKKMIEIFNKFSA
jgi:dihydropteroate synthase